jgi:hypothetical protein
MNFTVVWKPSAEAMLAHLWNTAPDQNAVARASDLIDDLLRRDPLRVGEQRSDQLRILIVPPLAVHYEVLEDDCIVRVVKVWRI